MRNRVPPWAPAGSQPSAENPTAAAADVINERRDILESTMASSFVRRSYGTVRKSLVTVYCRGITTS
jgi:hypothetical protein